MLQIASGDDDHDVRAEYDISKQKAHEQQSTPSPGSSSNTNLREIPSAQYTPIDANKLTFFDLSGEIRNIIYQYALKTDHPSNKITFVYRMHKRRLTGKTMYSQDTLKTLNALSGIHSAFRREARTFFFSNNALEVECRGEARGPSYLTILNEVLDRVGQDGRNRIFRLSVYSHGTYCNMEDICHEVRTSLSDKLAQCTALHALDLELRVTELFIDKSAFSTDNEVLLRNIQLLELVPTRLYKDFVALFGGVKSLQSLQVDALADRPVFRRHGDITRGICEQVVRVLDEMVRKENPSLRDQTQPFFTLWTGSID